MLFISGNQIVNLSGKGALDDAVIVIFGSNNADALRRFNKLGKRTNEPHSRDGFSRAETELLPQDAIEFSENESRGVEFDFSAPDTKEDLVRFAARESQGGN